MVFFGRENCLFATAPQAWVNGPVYPAIFHVYKDKVSNMCDHLDVQHFGISEGVDLNDIIYSKTGMMYTDYDDMLRRIYVACSRARKELILS